MTVVGLDNNNRQFKLVEEDSGIGWAVTFILLAIVIGFAIIMVLDRQPMVEYKVDKAFLSIQDNCPALRHQIFELNRQRTISDGSVTDLDEPVDLNSRSYYPIRAASVKRSNHVQ